jgi:uncharacterized protein (DUF736 family)
MPTIGLVALHEDGAFRGELRTISIRVPLQILPTARKGADARPDYRVLSDGLEFGAGWNRRSETSELDYVSLALAAPEFGPRRIYVTLVPVESASDSFAVVWIPAD